MSATNFWKHRSTSRLTCSGSRVSESVVNPTRSANSTVATRRSSLRPASSCPQEGQNLASSGTVAEQAGHVMGEVYGRPPGGTPPGFAAGHGIPADPRTRTGTAPIASGASPPQGERTLTATTVPPPPPTAAPARVAARAVHATKVYGMGDTQVIALNDVNVDFGESEFT